MSERTAATTPYIPRSKSNTTGIGPKQRQAIATLQADSAALYGRRETTLAAKWLTDAASAVERATAWLEAYARPRWTLSMTADLEPRVPPGGWFAIWHPLLPAVGKMRSLDAEWDFKAQVQRLTAECSVGPLPAVTVTGVGGLFEQPSSGLRSLTPMASRPW